MVLAYICNIYSISYLFTSVIHEQFTKSFVKRYFQLCFMDLYNNVQNVSWMTPRTAGAREKNIDSEGASRPLEDFGLAPS